MKFYLSSYKVGNEYEKLKKLVPTGKKLGFVPNAVDMIENLEDWIESNNRNIKDLTDLGIEVEMLDLKDYFGKKFELADKIDELGGVWIRGEILLF